MAGGEKDLHHVYIVVIRLAQELGGRLVACHHVEASLTTPNIGGLWW